MQTKVITRLSGYFFVFQKGETLKRFKEDCQRVRRPVVKAIIYIHVQVNGNPYRIQRRACESRTLLCKLR